MTRQTPDFRIPNPNPGFANRVGRAMHHVIEYDRRSWDRLLRQMAAQDACVLRSIKSMFRPAS